MKLELGLMKNTQIAAWFGVTEKTYTNARKKYLEKLLPFAKYKEVRGGIVIEEIFIDTYIKNLDDDVKVYLQQVQAAEDHLTSITGMSEVLCATSEFSMIPFRTMEGRMRRAGKKAFGETSVEGARGLYGCREFTWAIKLYDRPNHYRYMTKEEESRFDAIVSGFYSTEPERVKKAALLEEAFKTSDMTKEQYFQEKERLNLSIFYDVIVQFKIETGLQVVHATAHDIDEAYRESAF